MHSHTRPGFGRVDPAVDVFVATLAAGMILPAVQAAKGDADLMASQDDLRKIGQGVAEHAKDRGRLPYSTFHDNTQPKGTADPRFHTFSSGFVAILPYVGEGELFQKYDVALSPAMPAPETPQGTCPMSAAVMPIGGASGQLWTVPSSTKSQAGRSFGGGQSSTWGPCATAALAFTQPRVSEDS